VDRLKLKRLLKRRRALPSSNLPCLDKLFTGTTPAQITTAQITTAYITTAQITTHKFV
jgi:hypothetical protein